MYKDKNEAGKDEEWVEKQEWWYFAGRLLPLPRRVDRPLLQETASSIALRRIRILSLGYRAPHGRTEVVPRRLAVADQAEVGGKRRCVQCSTAGRASERD